MKKQSIFILNSQARDGALMDEILSRANFSVHEMEMDSFCLTSLAREAPDLILLAARTPCMDGVEACRLLKSEPSLRNTPVLLATDEADNGIRKAMIAGCADVITRPFTAEELLKRVDTHLQRRRLSRRAMAEIDRYRDLESAALHGILIHENGVIREVSDTMADMVESPVEDIIGRNVTDFIAPEDRGQVRKILKCPESESRCVLQALKNGGIPFPVEINGRSIQYQGRPARVSAIRDISIQWQLETENAALRAGLSRSACLGGLVGNGPAMHEVYNRILQAVACLDMVLIHGETGTGKELAAHTIFELSAKSEGPFVAVNCSAVQEPIFESMFFGHKKGAFTGADNELPGFFEQAAGGVLFLDEIGELTVTMQAKLLRVLQDREFTPLGTRKARSADVRIVSATNRNLYELVDSGRMREDFFHRIHVIPIGMPPLRAHKEDIALLADHFRQKRANNGMSSPLIPDRLMDQFMAYHWPGNVRELFNELRRYFATGEIGMTNRETLSRTSREVITGRTHAEIMENFEREMLADALRRHNGNRSKTAESLALQRKTLQRKIKKYNL